MGCLIFLVVWLVPVIWIAPHVTLFVTLLVTFCWGFFLALLLEGLG